MSIWDGMFTSSAYHKLERELKDMRAGRDLETERADKAEAALLDISKITGVQHGDIKTNSYVHGQIVKSVDEFVTLAGYYKRRTEELHFALYAIGESVAATLNPRLGSEAEGEPDEPA